MVQRLFIKRTFRVHTGCVNTSVFSPDGTQIISSGDDLKVVISDVNSGKRLFGFESLHRSNVFSAKVVGTARSVGVGAQIASAAADGQVRLHTVKDGGKVNNKRIFGHRGRAHKISVSDSNPFVICSAGEDGRVAILDIRMPHHEGSDQAGQLFRIVQTSRYGDGISGYGINIADFRPGSPSQLLVGGDDAVVRLYDIRRGTGSGFPSMPPAAAYCPVHMRPGRGRTAAGDGSGGSSSSGSAADNDDAWSGSISGSQFGSGTGSAGGGPATQAPVKAHVTGAAWNWCGNAFVATYNDEHAYEFVVDQAPDSDLGCSAAYGYSAMTASRMQLPRARQPQTSVMYAEPSPLKLRDSDNNPIAVIDLTEDEQDFYSGYGTVPLDPATAADNENAGHGSIGSEGGTTAEVTEQGDVPARMHSYADLSPAPASPWQLPGDITDPDVRRQLEAHNVRTQFNPDAGRALHWWWDFPRSTPQRLAYRPSSALSPLAGARAGAGSNGDDTAGYAADPPGSRGTFSQVFKGHRNSDTVKGVSYYGPRSEWVVQGCDTGHIFFYRTATGRIVNMVKGDVRGAVNSLTPHPDPLQPALLTSGLEHTAKLWQPSGDAEPASADDVTRVTQRNDRDRDGGDSPWASSSLGSGGAIRISPGQLLALLMGGGARVRRVAAPASGESEVEESEEDDDEEEESDEEEEGKEEDKDDDELPSRHRATAAAAAPTSNSSAASTSFTAATAPSEGGAAADNDDDDDEEEDEDGSEGGPDDIFSRLMSALLGAGGAGRRRGLAEDEDNDDDEEDVSGT